MSKKLDLEDALSDFHAALKTLIETGENEEIAVVTSVAIYGQEGKVQELQMCWGFKDIIRLQLDSLQERINLNLDYECKCGRIVMDTWESGLEERKNGRQK